jgi:hypothetical protein
MKEPTITVSFTPADKRLLERLRVRTKIYKNTDLFRFAIREALAGLQRKTNGAK